MTEGGIFVSNVTVFFKWHYVWYPTEFLSVILPRVLINFGEISTHAQLKLFDISVNYAITWVFALLSMTSQRDIDFESLAYGEIFRDFEGTFSNPYTIAL